MEHTVPKKEKPLKNSRRNSAPPQTHFFSPAPNCKPFFFTETINIYTKLIIWFDLNHKHHQSWTGLSQPASTQRLSRRAKLHQSLLILAAPERRSGLQYEDMSSAIGPACCSTVWKHNAGILMDRTACPLSRGYPRTAHIHIYTHTRQHTDEYAQARIHTAHIKARYIFPSEDPTRPFPVCK